MPIQLGREERIVMGLRAVLVLLNKMSPTLQCSVPNVMTIRGGLERFFEDRGEAAAIGHHWNIER